MQPSTATAAAVPEWLRGLWRRRSIRFADGSYDDTTVVYWLQGDSAFADIRIPAGRPVIRDRDELAELSDGELLALTRQGGFAVNCLFGTPSQSAFDMADSICGNNSGMQNDYIDSYFGALRHAQAERPGFDGKYRIVVRIREGINKSLPVEVLDQNGQAVEGLSLSPREVQVTLPISQQGGYRDLAVKVVVQGQVAGGYRLTDLSVFPPVVTVFSSDPNVVSALPGVVETQPLDLRNASEDITTRLDLNLPEGVSVVGEQTVLIQAGISPIESSLTLSNEVVQVVGLPPGLTAQVLPATVDVIISGPLPLLDTLTRQDIRVTVDLTGLAAGTHQLTPRVEILIADVIVESILPGTVEVTLVSSGTPYPLPTPSPTPTPK